MPEAPEILLLSIVHGYFIYSRFIGYVFESAIIFLNSYFYCWSEKLNQENWQEDEEFVKELSYSLV
jgi:hypothetical protein